MSEFKAALQKKIEHRPNVSQLRALLAPRDRRVSLGLRGLPDRLVLPAGKC
jgi:hypothetical protein